MQLELQTHWKVDYGAFTYRSETSVFTAEMQPVQSGRVQKLIIVIHVYFLEDRCY